MPHDDTTAALQPARPRNASLIYDARDAGFLGAAMAALGAPGARLLVSDDPELRGAVGADHQIGFAEAGLNSIPIQFDAVRKALAAQIATSGAKSVAVDMRWGLSTVSAAANFENWGVVCHRLAEELGADLVSVYDRSLLIDDQYLAAFRGHSQFLAPSGVYENPFWMPPAYLEGATLGEQLTLLLGRVVPDHAGTEAYRDPNRDAASGANPGWIDTPGRLRPRTSNSDIWKIRCFGRLRIYLSDSTQVKWDIPGSAPKKSKALFAYLLHLGEKGARAERLAELLWPDEPDEAVKRRRLHHAIATLRKTLGGKEFVRRNGEYYSLVPPVGTWIDIASFEQLCNRAKVLAKAGQEDDAITLLDAADRLYSGDLFEDISEEYFDGDIEDWLVPRRVWLKEMAIKVQRDKAVILRGKGRLREALACCQKALEMDPASEIAHAEAMRIFHAQGRPETMIRQYRQFRASQAAIGAEGEPSDVEDLYRELISTD